MSKPTNRQPMVSRRDCFKLGAAAIASMSQFNALAARAMRQGDSKRRVLILGIDGMSPYLLQQYVSEGKMPHFARLMRDGDFKPLRSSNPPQSPVAWSNFITGMNPGQHGIYDFIHRDPKTMAPMLSTSQTLPPSTVLPIGGWRLPLAGGGVKQLRKGPAFWQQLSEHGVPCTLYRMPTNFPPVECDAQTLSGLGTPDLLGAYGVPSYITDHRPPNADSMHDVNLQVVDMSKHACEASILGPDNTLKKNGGPVHAKMKIYRDPVNAVARIDIQGRTLLLNEGEWSDWTKVSFTMMPGVADVSGMCRFFMKQIHGRFQLYVTPVNIDPREPALPISTPEDYSRELAETLGPYYTQGIAEDTKSLSVGLFNDADYHDQAMLVLGERMKAYDHLLDNFHRGLLFFYISTLDVNSHMFWRAMDPRSPVFTPELGEQYGKTIEDLYIRMDGVLAKAMEKTDENTTLIVLSDHGFRPFHRTFAVNGWLLQNQYAALKSADRRGENALFGQTDWKRTYAYGLGINGVYLNLRGRERDGILTPGRQADMMLDRIAEELSAATDPETGETVFREVYKGRDIYHGAEADKAPDLVLGFRPGYRASWDTILGSYEDEIVADNMDPWSGDHCMDVNGLNGVLLSNRKIQTDRPTLMDLAPTILAEYGLETPAGTEGRVIFEPT